MRARPVPHHAHFARLVRVASLCFALSSASPARAVPGDELWSSRWSRPGADQQLEATAEFAGHLVVGGSFRFIGDVVASRVAVYNGVVWAPLGDGFDDDVRALAVYNGELYAGGDFTASGATPLSGLARWTGSAWVDVGGGGVEGYVNALTVFNGALVVGGSFTEVGGGTAAGSIATWNGTAWGTMAGGFGESDIVNDLAVFSSALYVTGRFTIAGPTAANNIARWSGTAWSALGSGLRDDTGDPFEAEGLRLHVWSSRVVVTGTFGQAGGNAYINFATHNGTTWATLGANPSFFSSGASEVGDVSGSLLVHAGFGSTYRWNGASWVSFTSNAYVFCMGRYGTDLVVGGIFDQIGGVQAEKLARYNGTVWSAMATGDGATPGVQGLYPQAGGLIAGGSAGRFGGVANSLIARWNGTSWSGFGTGIPPGSGRLVTTFAELGSDLVAGGVFPQAGGVTVDKIARWNGAAWSAMGGFNTTCEALKTLRGTLYAYGTVGLTTAVVRWDGAAWVNIGTTNDIVWDLEEYQGQLVAAGTFSSIGGATIRGLARWDSTSGAWSAIGASTLNNSVFAIEVDGDDLYIGGTFTSLAGNTVNRVARWDGTTWHALASGVNNRVLDLKLHQGELFATGEFVTAGGNPALYIARWDGGVWNAMGSGLDARGRVLAVYDDELVVGGDFSSAGGRYASGIATWADPSAVSVGDAASRSSVLSIAAMPSPFSHTTTLTWRLAAPAPVRVRVFDLAGREMATLVDATLAAGPHSATWDGRAASGERLRAGIYLCRIEAGPLTATRRVVHVR